MFVISHDSCALKELKFACDYEIEALIIIFSLLWNPPSTALSALSFNMTVKVTSCHVGLLSNNRSNKGVIQTASAKTLNVVTISKHELISSLCVIVTAV